MNSVRMLKTRFENLNNSSGIADALDITPIRERREQLKFSRSATCIDFSKFRLNEVHKDPVIVPHSNAPDTNRSQPTFQRQLSNSSNTSQKSIRRSPAFRFDAHCRPSIVKNITKEEQDKRKTEIDKELEYMETSSTIKKALMRPLPKGSPPKKPPRVFLSPPPTNVEYFSPESLQERMQKLKISPNTLPKKTSAKSEEKKAISSFLNCIISPCSIDPVYYEHIRREQREKRESPEQIYAEPYAHLSKDFQKNVTSPKEELHYMCTDLSASTDFNGNLSREDQRRNSVETSDIEDFEKVNLLMNVVYDEKHRDSIIDETSHSSTESTKSPVQKGISRSLTEKRKKYVRRMTQISMSLDCADNGGREIKSYRSFKEIASTMSKISHFQSIIDANKPKDEKKVEKPRGLFDMALLIGFDVTKMDAYVKSVYPKTAKPPEKIGQFVYPTVKTPSDLMTRENQNFCLVLTDEYGSHMYAYCRQVVPEGFEICLPLTYCIISGVNASGFYFNVLKEIEARHGQPEAQFTHLLQQLQRQELPKSGKSLHVKLMESPMNRKCPEIAKKPDRETIQKSQARFNKRLSLEPPEWLKNENSSSEIGSANRSLENGNRIDEVVIRRPNDLRLESCELSVLYECLTSELLVIIFGTLLIERKVMLIGRNISKLSSCVLALHSILYPFQWQHTIIAITPDSLNELLEAPFPILAGFLKDSVNLSHLEIEDGIVVDIETKSLLKKCGDDSTLVPETLKKSLMLSLKIVDALDKGKSLSNVIIAEAFLQFFVKIFANLSTKTFSKEKFIELHPDLAVKHFLEWFLETIMFKEFLRKKSEHDKQRDEGATAPHYFDIFNAKVLEKSATISNHQQRKNVELLMKNSKQFNRKRNFRDRMRDFLSNKTNVHKSN